MSRQAITGVFLILIDRSSTPTPPAASVVRRAESIGLLHLLHAVPSLPSSNLIDPLRVRQEGYIVSFERERCLVSTLAFLSSISDDPNLIPAAAVQQGHNPASLSVLLAVNKQKQDDGNQFLQDIKQGFEGIFTALSRAVDGTFSVVYSFQRLPFQDRTFYRSRTMSSVRL